MSVKPNNGDGWVVDVRPQGREGKRIRKKFVTKAEAVQYERWGIATQNNKDWVEKPADRRQLSELIALWWKHHGQTLKDGTGAKKKLEKMDRDMGEPRADQLTVAFVSEFRSTRLESGRLATTVNRECERLSAVFGTLIKLKLFNDPNPLDELKGIREKVTEMGFLSLDEIRLLINKLSGDDRQLVKLCLATGARWSEAARLRMENAIKDRVTFIDTKNGKNRTVPVSHSLFKEIVDGKNRILFPNANYQRILRHLKGVAPDLPKGQAVHVFRHTFASHFMMNGGNILALQKILGHANIMQTMVYAHFAPDYLSDAVRFNPLESI